MVEDDEGSLFKKPLKSKLGRATRDILRWLFRGPCVEVMSPWTDQIRVLFAFRFLNLDRTLHGMDSCFQEVPVMPGG